MKKRVSFDRLGNPVIEIKNKDGFYERAVDRDALEKLNVEHLTVSSAVTRASGVHRKLESNPYGGAAVVDSKKLRKRSGLDYLRTLSAEIQKRRKPDE